MQEPDLLRAALPYVLVSVAPLAWVARRIASGRSLIKYEPRRPVPWTGPFLAAVVLLFLLLPVAMQSFAAQRFLADLSPEARAEFQALLDDEKLAHQGFTLVMWKADCAGKLIFAAVAVAMAAVSFRADARDLGLSLHRFGRRLLVGLAGFFVVTPPVLALQGAVIYLSGIKYDHPLVKGMRDQPDREMILWSLIVAIVVAPLVEELFFRGFLQGWLERAVQTFQAAFDAERLRGRNAADAVAAPASQSDGTLLLADAPPTDSSSTPIIVHGPSHIPNVITSLLFAMAHWGHGPPPISLFFFSLGLGYLYRQTHSLWPSIVMHFLLNAFSMGLLLSGAAEA